MENPRIVLIDDHREFREVLALLLARRFNATVEATFDNGETALEHLRQHPVDIILVDYKMPGMSGLDLIRELQTLDPPPTTYLVSFNPLPELREAALQAGATAVLSKSEIEADLAKCLPIKP